MADENLNTAVLKPHLEAVRESGQFAWMSLCDISTQLERSPFDPCTMAHCMVFFASKIKTAVHRLVAQNDIKAAALLASDMEEITLAADAIHEYCRELLGTACENPKRFHHPKTGYVLSVLLDRLAVRLDACSCKVGIPWVEAFSGGAVPERLAA